MSIIHVRRVLSDSIFPNTPNVKTVNLNSYNVYATYFEDINSLFDFQSPDTAKKPF